MSASTQDRNVLANRNVIDFTELRMSDVEFVGGKNASLGEMISQLAAQGVRVPGGYATTAHAYREFLAHNNLAQRIDDVLATLDVDDVRALAQAGKLIRDQILATPFPPELEAEVRAHYASLGDNVTVAVRSSATAEDLPDASFAGQQETYLNIVGADNVLEAIKHVFASLYNDRAISYRVHKGFDHKLVALSAGVQRMVRSDKGAAGVMFSIDTETGFDQVVFVTASYGLGETVVQGAVNPDEFYVHKPTLRAGRPAIVRKHLGGKAIKMEFDLEAAAGRSVKTVPVDAAARRQFSISDAEVEELAGYALTIEAHYKAPMDIEWGRDGIDGKLYILQARPETVKSQEAAAEKLSKFRLLEQGEVLTEGRAVGQKIGAGRVRIIRSVDEMDKVRPGDVLVSDMTDPDWEPVMKRAAAIVTNRGGRTCHAAIIARELGIPAVVGTGDATRVLEDGAEVTVSCAEGDTGRIYAGLLKFEKMEVALATMPEAPVKLMMNVGNPELAFEFAQLPNEGVGLARLEFIINRMIGVHPKALLAYPNLPADLKAKIDERIAGYRSAVDFYVDKLAEGIATLGAAFWPKKVIVRLSDFKSNEYANLIGGPDYEPHEENPMIGFRGAARYVDPSFRDCFELECRAMKKVRDGMGLTNVEVMIPFVRTVSEAAKVIELLAANGLKRGEGGPDGKAGLRVIMMCEIPANAVLAEQFLQYFDGFSIGSNDMTQLTLGIDRDSGGPVSVSFDERNDAVKAMLAMSIAACRKLGKYIGICGQGPSDHPDFALWLVEQGIETISLNPDTVVETWLYLAREAG
ncbi:phosphoenolpyruvate synthase [Andreprevotia lacus DSM 23236]|jgi:pyruvate,water dikinase|uniref:Phosphoenolpyruvate synthase n=1 Tax=Andreprevotia lacus DSM 23236 TaxID=1121001 RepID=A0A1W1XDM3_9NEIS|nr:phosphoenolpyruvate synthase [Andreprevotia lacus]SMC21989.1 phosphoenolpyruvate synthase [Andreprevotia lacus DSM 23236]